MHGTGSRVGKPPTHVTASYSLKAGDTYAASLSHLRVWRHRADGGDILCTEGNATAITFFVASSNFADDETTTLEFLRLQLHHLHNITKQHMILLVVEETTDTILSPDLLFSANDSFVVLTDFDQILNK
ncbi:hypothetical protein PPL_10369 [Heterostelium album PN500]|uniref:Uncharacterized protein n=1 Tax=Heterostelium pallidum (strain ATCC 26659 / Pp 5 / PN500) TaxID=670386 RepID=D3BQW6_HETP5|nr:hypothetical protein PPL_10369 [Heterostelium album PN500]EFA76203.1 hypothetical protein PPL_10369 [Heterostelium album PN500]|eukprot:XP_020428336.1 hypothetical protein PPL_10369 [Heterostelium album PN500]